MRTKLRSKFSLLFVALAALIAIPAAALASDVDVAVVDVTAPTGSVSLEPGQSGNININMSVTGNQVGTATFEVNRDWVLNYNSTTNTYSFAASNPQEFTVNPREGGDPATTFSTTGKVSVASGVPASATARTLSVGVFDITNTNDSGAKLSAGRSGNYSVTVLPPSNQAPSVPGVPSGTSPNQGTFALNWAASTDDGKPAGSSVTYTLQHKNSAASAVFSDVATGISGNSYQFGDGPDANTDPDNPVEAEGTWTYRVKASDGSLSSAFSAASGEIVVDQSRPNAPLANEGTPDYTASTGEKWFKNSATVTFAANGDPNLADGSLGSGVASVSAAQSRSTTGALTYSGTAIDNVGLVSLPTASTVYVDATNPEVNITCPTSSAILGSTASANWSASDVGSGLATAASGSVALNTSAIAASLTATAPTATDNVGLQSAADTCNYSVAAGFHGFLQPIDGNLVNTGKFGRVYPVKWQLKDSSQNLISDAAAEALVSSMTVKQVSTSCTTGEADALETEAGAAGSTSVRYDATSDQFIFNYKAPSSGSCYALNINKADGVNTQSIQFKFTK